MIQRLPRASEGDRPSGSVWVGQMPLPAAYLATNAQRARVLMGRRDRGGVRIGRRFYPGGLWAGVGVGGHVGVFTRRGRTRLPIVEQTVTLEISESARARGECA